MTDQTLHQRSVELVKRISKTHYGSPAFVGIADSFRMMTFPKVTELTLNINPQKVSSRLQTLNEEAAALSVPPKQSKFLRFFKKTIPTAPVDIGILQKFYRNNYKTVLRMLDETAYTHFQLTAHRKDITETLRSLIKLQYYFQCIKEQLFQQELPTEAKQELQTIIVTKEYDLKEYTAVVEHSYSVNENLIKIYDDLTKMLYDMRKKMQETLNYQANVESKITAIENSFISVKNVENNA